MAGRVFIADRDPEQLEDLVKQLEQAGYDVISADNGKDAAELLNVNNPPKVIVLDAVLAEKNTVDLIQTIQGDLRLKAIPIVVTLDSTSNDRPFLDLGIFDFVSRPLTLSSLKQKIDPLIKYGGKQVAKKKGIDPTLIALAILGLGTLLILFVIFGATIFSGKQ